MQLSPVGKLACITTLLVCMPGISANAQVTLDFEYLSNPNAPLVGYNNQPLVLHQDGFSLTDTGPIVGYPHSVSPDGGAEGYNYTGSVAIFNGSTDGSETLTQDNTNPFTVNSIDVANLQLQSTTPGGVTVLFTGNLEGGGTVTQSFTHATDDSLTTVTFGSGFANLASFTINQTAPYNQFDNIVIDSAVDGTPEPGSFALLSGLSLCGLAFGRRRRQKA